MFQIDLDNYDTIKFVFMDRGWSGKEIESMPYYEFEDKVEKLSEVLKKQSEAEKNANKNAQIQQPKVDPARQANSLMQKVSSGMPKMPAPPRMR